jgi:hypothetical protein
MGKGSGSGSGGVGGHGGAGASGGGAGGAGYDSAAAAAANYFSGDAGRAARIRDYTGPGYSRMNELLRNGYDAYAAEHGSSAARRQLDKARALQRDLAHAPEAARYKGTVVRGTTMARAEIDKMRRTGQWTNKSMLSTTISKGVAHDFGGYRTPTPGKIGVRFTILQRSGVAVERASAASSEREVLIRAGVRFRVVSVRVRAGVAHVKMEQL